MRAYERLIKYVQVDTVSSPVSDTTPTTAHQFDLANLLVAELKAMGVSDARVDDKCYVYATLPGTIPGKPLGLIAHMDTSPDVSGANVKPRIIKNYDGKDITLENGIQITVKDYDYLPGLAGQDLIVTDGNTLLGADDKAGVAEIMTLLKRLTGPDAPAHLPLRIAFTPDEEVGCGADHFDVAGFDAAYAYTVDGGALGELEYENFNAASMRVVVNGVNIHPGSAKDKMKNASLLALAFANMMPPAQTPAHTEHYEGFYHLSSIQGNEERAELHYIIRDHSMEKFLARKAFVQKTADYLNERYGAGTFELTVKDSYYNMAGQFKGQEWIIEKAKKAFEDSGVTPLVQPIRGGTDGARLSFMGLPCPNLSTGGYNFHGRKELIPVQAMDRMVDVLLALVK